MVKFDAVEHFCTSVFIRAPLKVVFRAVRQRICADARVHIA
jgi:hypothetical protein